MAKRFPDLIEEARSSGVDELSVKQLFTLRKAKTPMLLIDIREADERVDGAKLKNSVHIPRGLLEINIERHVRSRNELLILMCSDGMRSILGAESLRRMGYSNTQALAGGFRALIEAARPQDD